MKTQKGIEAKYILDQLYVFDSIPSSIIQFETELGTSLFEFAQLLFALEWTLISGANEQFKKKSDEQIDKIKFRAVRSWAI